MIFNGPKILFYLGTTTSVLTTTYQCPPTTIPCSKEPICYLTSEICDGKCDCLVHCDDEKDCSAYFFLNHCAMVCACKIRMHDPKCYSVFYYTNLKKEVFTFV